MSTQFKTFKLSDKGSEALINEWFKENYFKVQMRADNKGPNVQIVGNADPVMVIQYDSDEKNSKEYAVAALTEELAIRSSKLVLSIQQLEEHREKIKVVPQFNPTKGKQTPTKTKAYETHEQGIELTKRDIILQKADIRALKTLIKDIDKVVKGVVHDNEKSLDSEGLAALEESVK